MLRQTILLVIIAFLVVFGSFAYVIANGDESKTKTDAATTILPPTGQGPSDASNSISITSVSAIEKRGHSDNECEALVMLMDTIRSKGGIKVSGDYRVAYIISSPKGWYEANGDQLTWRPPAPTETAHIEAVVMDSLTGQILPIDSIILEVIDSEGKTVQSQKLTYYWHPMYDHYGTNYSIPAAGVYSLRVRAPMPAFRRHNKDLGNRFTLPLDVTFTDVRISPMSADSEPAPETQTK